MRPFYIIVGLTAVLGRSYDTQKKSTYTVNNRGIEDGSNRNEWTQFEFGFIEGLLKYEAQRPESNVEGGSTCFSQGMEMFQTWATLIVKWATEELERGEADEDLEDPYNWTDTEDPTHGMTTTVFISMTLDLLYKCNYAATIEGILINKMLVDSVFMAKFIPKLVRWLLFPALVIPINFYILIDDIVGGILLYTRLSEHNDLFDYGIITGKVMRLLFQIYIFWYMVWDNFIRNFDPNIGNWFDDINFNFLPF